MAISLQGSPQIRQGGYGIQGAFAKYIDRIDGDYYNVVGAAGLLCISDAERNRGAVIQRRK